MNRQAALCQDSCEAQDPQHRLPGEGPAEGPRHPRPAAGWPSVARPHVPAPTLTRRGISRKAHRLGLPVNQPLHPSLPWRGHWLVPLSVAGSDSDRPRSDLARKQTLQDSDPGLSELWPGPSLRPTVAERQPQTGRPRVPSPLCAWARCWGLLGPRDQWVQTRKPDTVGSQEEPSGLLGEMQAQYIPLGKVHPLWATHWSRSRWIHEQLLGSRR